MFDWLFRLHITPQITPLVSNGLGADTQTDTHMPHTHTDVRIKVISRNQARAGLRPARAWFKNLSCCLRLFADDCLLYHVITSEEDCAKLQHDLNTIYKWSCTWQMKFNLSKCVTLKCYRSSSPIEIDYFINDHKLENVKHHPYLGITLDQTMSFIPHLNNITSKATRVLNFIKQNLSKCSQYTKSNTYFSLVRPSLEYASSIWDPYYNTHISTIEKIQRRAVRWTLNNYNRYSSVTSYHVT